MVVIPFMFTACGRNRSDTTETVDVIVVESYISEAITEPTFTFEIPTDIPTTLEAFEEPDEPTPFDPYIHGFLSRITYGENVAYIMGSMHMGRPDWFPLAEIVQDAMERSDIFVFEYDLTTTVSPQVHQRMMDTYVNLPDGITLEDVLPDDVFAHFYAMLETFPVVTYRMVSHFTPAQALNFIGMVEGLPLMGIQTRYSVDFHIRDFALENSRQIAGLNTIFNEWSLLFGWPEAVQISAMAEFTDFETFAAEFHELRLADAYAHQDADWIHAAAIQPMIEAAEYSAYADYFLNTILFERGTNFANAIERLLRETQQPTTFFITVGAAHVIKGHVFGMLECSGFVIESIWDSSHEGFARLPCDDAYFPEVLTLESVLRLTNQRRQIINTPDMTQIQNWIAERGPITLDAARLFNDQRTANLTSVQAADDIETLFELLRHVYAAYHFFGGDDVFLPMRDRMLAEIHGRETWTSDQLFQQIQHNLGAVINDFHFNINAYNSSTFGNRYNSFIWDTPFDRGANGFSKRDTSLYVSHVENHNINEVFRLTMNEAGEIYYAPVFFLNAEQGIIGSLSMTFEDGEQQTVNLVRTPHTLTHAMGARHSLTFQNGIPIVSIRRMGDSFNHHAIGHQEALQALSYVEYLRGEPVIIIDIRSNEGGASALPSQWLYRLIGEYVPTNFNWLNFSDTELYIPSGVSRPTRWYRGFNNRAGFDFEYPPALFERYIPLEPIAEGIYFTPEKARDRLISNDQLIIVLIDRFTLSAGEIFTDQFTNIENTLILGQNTFGMLLTSSNLPLYLPNSGMPVIMGQHTFIHPEGSWEEGIGFAPDIWVVGDALTAALALLGD